MSYSALSQFKGGRVQTKSFKQRPRHHKHSKILFECTLWFIWI